MELYYPRARALIGGIIGLLFASGLSAMERVGDKRAREAGQQEPAKKVRNALVPVPAVITSSTFLSEFTRPALTARVADARDEKEELKVVLKIVQEVHGDALFNALKAVDQPGSNLNSLIIDSSRQKGCTLLHLAARLGAYHLVRKLLNKGADVQALDQDNNTALHYASLAGNADVVTLLLQKNADVDAWGACYCTPLHCASNNGHVPVVRQLLARNADPRRINEIHATPMHYAAARDNLAIVKILAGHNALIDAKDKQGWTSLHLAARCGHTGIVRYLLKRNADVNAQGQDALTPLDLASHFDRTNIVKILKENGATRSKASQSNVPAAENGYASSVRSEVRDEENDAAQLLAQLGGSQPQTAANESRSEQTEVAQLLTQLGGSPPQSAAKESQDKQTEVTQLSTQLSSSRPQSAVTESHLQQAGLLVQRDAPIDAAKLCAQLGISAAESHPQPGLLVQRDEQIAADMLPRISAPEPPLSESNPESLNDENFSDEMQLLMAVLMSDTDRIVLLLKKGVCINSILCPLHEAIRGGKTDVANLLIGRRLFLEEQDYQGNTALHLAVLALQPELVASLIAAGAPLNSKNKEGKTALMIAGQLAKIDLIALLLESGADQKVLDEKGKGYLDYMPAHFQRIIKNMGQIRQ